MSFDPTKPIDVDFIVAAELHNQFNGLKALIDTVPSGPPGPAGPAGEVTAADLVNERINHARNPTGVSPLSLVASDPPTQAEFQALIDKVNELITALRREP